MRDLGLRGCFTCAAHTARFAGLMAIYALPFNWAEELPVRLETHLSIIHRRGPERRDLKSPHDQIRGYLELDLVPLAGISGRRCGRRMQADRSRRNAAATRSLPPTASHRTSSSSLQIDGLRRAPLLPFTSVPQSRKAAITRVSTPVNKHLTFQLPNAPRGSMTDKYR